MPLVFSERSQCEGKIRYHSKRAAREANLHKMAEGGERLKVYRCTHCGGWHMGHHVKYSYETDERGSA